MTRSLSPGLLVSLLALVACGGATVSVLDSSREDPGGTSSTTESGGSGPGGGTGQSGQAGGGGAPGLLRCGAALCSSGQICCVLDNTCVTPGDQAACPSPAQTSPKKHLCNSDADCDTGWFCQHDGGLPLCQGTGACIERGNCGTSEGGNGLCGCDGKTYASVQDACLAGVSLAAQAPCGDRATGDGGSSQGPKYPMPVVCGWDSSYCPAGSECCVITGECYEPGDWALCAMPPPGTLKACRSDADCHYGTYCYAEDSCSGPGGCVPVGSSQCAGVLDPVCGCDGKSYTNAACARAAGVRVASKGECAAP